MATTEIFANVFQLSGTGTATDPYKIVDSSGHTGLQSEYQDKTVNDSGTDITSRLGDVSRDTFTVDSSGSGGGGGTYTYVGTATVNGTVQGIIATDGNETFLFTHGTTNNFTTGEQVTLNASVPGSSGSNQWLLSGSGTSGTVICFYPGTLIRTPAGEQAVETLSIGDLVLTNEGKALPVRWMGRQTVSTVFADPLRVLPICIRAGALGDNLPVRDLLVSPDHALLVDGILIQAGALVNDSTIIREHAVPQVFTYWHVELADHSLILAEGVPVETFVDNIDRLGFDNWDEHEALYGDQPAIAELDLPRAKSARQVPAATRRRLAAHGVAVSSAVAAVA